MNTTRLLLICWLLASSFAGLARAGVLISETAVDRAVTEGLNPLFDSVGYFRQETLDGTFFAGSGVLLEPNWVLTAGHVALEGRELLRGDVTFNVGDDVFAADNISVDVAEIFVFPTYFSDTIPPGTNTDLALFRLAKPVIGVQPAIRLRDDDSGLIGSRVRMSGFGETGVFPFPQLRFDGKKRSGENIVEQFGSITGFSTNFFLTNFDRFGRGLPLEYTGANGDSGGGIFDDDGLLVGINAFQTSGHFFSGSMRIAPFNDWIDATIAANTVPEPATAVLLSCGVFILSYRRRSVAS